MITGAEAPGRDPRRHPPPRRRRDRVGRRAGAVGHRDRRRPRRGPAPPPTSWPRPSTCRVGSTAPTSRRGRRRWRRRERDAPLEACPRSSSSRSARSRDPTRAGSTRTRSSSGRRRASGRCRSELARPAAAPGADEALLAASCSAWPSRPASRPPDPSPPRRRRRRSSPPGRRSSRSSCALRHGRGGRVAALARDFGSTTTCTRAARRPSPQPDPAAAIATAVTRYQPSSSCAIPALGSEIDRGLLGPAALRAAQLGDTLVVTVIAPPNDVDAVHGGVRQRPDGRDRRRRERQLVADRDRHGRPARHDARTIRSWWRSAPTPGCAGRDDRRRTETRGARVRRRRLNGMARGLADRRRGLPAWAPSRGAGGAERGRQAAPDPDGAVLAMIAVALAVDVGISVGHGSRLLAVVPPTLADTPRAAADGPPLCASQ